MVLQFDVNMKRTRQIGNIEHRLLFVLSFFAVSGVVSLVFLAAVSAKADKFLNATQQYMACEALGSNATTCDHFIVDLNVHGVNPLRTVIYAMMGSIPFIILIFTINWSHAGKFVNKIFHCWGQASRSRHNQTSAVFSTFSPAPITSVSNWWQQLANEWINLPFQFELIIILVWLQFTS